jgi:hypothetical protein
VHKSLSNSHEDTGGISVVSSVAGNDSLASEDDASSWLGLCLAVSAREEKVSSDGGSTTRGSSRKSDEGKISLSNGTMPVHRNPDTAFYGGR